MMSDTDLCILYVLYGCKAQILVFDCKIASTHGTSYIIFHVPTITGTHKQDECLGVFSPLE